MRKLNSTILIGLVVAIIGAVLVFFYGRNVDNKVADGKQTKKVLIATQNLSGGLRADQIGGAIEVREVPDAYLADGYISDPSQLVGKVLLGPVGKDAQLTTASFGSQAESIAVAPSKGKIALAVSTDLTPGVARYIQAGSSVDMFVTYTAQPPSTGAGSSSSSGSSGGSGSQLSGSRGLALTKLFMSAVKVLSVEVAPVAAKDDNNNSSLNSTASTAVQGVLAVLDVTPTDAEKIVNATGQGTIYLGLSAIQGDATVHRTPKGATADDVVRSNR